VTSVAYSFQHVFSVPAKAEQDVRAIQQQSNGSLQSKSEVRGGSRTPIRGIHGSRAINGHGDRSVSRFSFSFLNLEMAGVLLLLGSIATWHDAVAASGEGKMRSTRWYAFRLSSKHCSTCENLRRLKARIEAAPRNARNLERAASGICLAA